MSEPEPPAAYLVGTNMVWVTAVGTDELRLCRLQIPRLDQPVDANVNIAFLGEPEQEMSWRAFRSRYTILGQVETPYAVEQQQRAENLEKFMPEAVALVHQHILLQFQAGRVEKRLYSLIVGDTSCDLLSLDTTLDELFHLTLETVDDIEKTPTMLSSDDIEEELHETLLDGEYEEQRRRARKACLALGLMAVDALPPASPPP